MASENAKKLELGSSAVPDQTKPKKDWILLSLRVVALLATASATLVMALNKQSKNLVVATIGTNPITATISAKFHHTPAFVFFVIVNGIASVRNMVVIALDFFRTPV
uniref:CASP-like protein n=1 Tax=Lotus japonicus TaxID=34305 RepID=I3S142_LOTJA|nr:unknown [Lotus japonicus]